LSLMQYFPSLSPLFIPFIIAMRYTGFFTYYLLPSSCSLLPAPCSLTPETGNKKCTHESEKRSI
ncbi:hypothetical protein, partial [Moorena sp. SIO3H5]|uniref:hypothetical protein n=1 Tax=Moorena sp. SIO3H5 TaxID=2607834 RepID=UPI0025EAA025